MQRLAVFSLFLLTVSVYSAQSKILAGVTIESYPFTVIENNRFTGLCVELMNEIRALTGLNYSLYLVKDRKYGSRNATTGSITGMIGDVYSKKADFAIADLTVTSVREKYVAFTRPFFQFSVSGLVHKQHVGRLKTIHDLALKSNLSVGVLSRSSIFAGMAEKKDVRDIRWLHQRILQNESNLLPNEEVALRRVKTEPFVFLQEEPHNVFRAMEDCNLTVLHDPQFYFLRQYAIAMPKDSPYLTPFNAALKQLEKEGFLTRLKKKYFTGSCNASPALLSSSFVTILISLIALCIFHFH